MVDARNDEYSLCRTLLGTYPEGGSRGEELETWRERIDQYVRKAAREAKRHTGWILPDEQYEQALARFIATLIGGGERPGPFLEDLQVQSARLAWFGALKGLSHSSFAPGFSRKSSIRASIPLCGQTWTDTAVAADRFAEGTRFTHVLTGEEIAVRGGLLALAETFASSPAAALISGAGTVGAKQGRALP